MFEKVTVAYRGAKYEIGRGRGFYGIWGAGESRSQPLERWPEAPEGWSAAWARFTELEEPGTIAPVGRNAARAGTASPASPAAASPAGPEGAGQSTSPAGLSATAGAVVAAVLLIGGVALGIAGLFPDYYAGASLVQQSAQLVPHVIYLATWTVSAALILMGGSRLRAGALLGTGLSAVTLGLFLADVGTPIAGGAHLAGAGMWLSLAGWLACAAGSVVAFLLQPAGPLGEAAEDRGPLAGSAQDTRPFGEAARQAGRRGLRAHLGMPRGAALGPAVLLVLAGLGVAAAFAPAWDSYTLRIASGQTQYLEAGNAFANPAPVIAGDVIVMVAFAAAVIAAAAWRPVRHGAILLAGAVIPMVAQAISAVIQVTQATPPQQFGLSPSQATALGLTISNGLTPAFWIYCAFGIVLVVSCLWMLFTPQALHAPQAPQQAYPSSGNAEAQAAAAEDGAYGWRSDAYAWYAATPEATGVSSPAADATGVRSPAAATPAEADAPKAAGGQTAAENDQAS